MLIGLFYIIIPLFLIGMIAFKRQPSIMVWVFTILSFGLVIAYLWATARWEIVSIYFRPIFPILYLMACVVGYRRILKPKTPSKKIVLIFSIGLHIILIVFFSGLTWNLGMRASSFAGGTDLNDYVIYGEPIYSPCNGTVVKVIDEYDDLKPPNTDKIHLAGNYILIESDGVEILLAHLKKGSNKVNVGDAVTTNTLLGQVGNTGNTSEPHLHMHIEKGGEPNTILNGEAVPFTINKQFLVRGNLIPTIMKSLLSILMVISNLTFNEIALVA